MHELLQESPFADIELLTVSERVARSLTYAEQKALLAACAHDLELDCFVRFGLDSGCRADEVSHCLWKNVNLDEGIALIECSPAWRTKNRRPWYVAFTRETATLLGVWQHWRSGKPCLFAEEGEDRREYYGRIRRKFRLAVKTAGIAPCTTHVMICAARGQRMRERPVCRRR